MTSKSTASSPRARFIAVTSSLVMALGLSACQVNSPITTDLQYAAADGTNLQTEGVSIDGMAIISAGSGSAGILAGAAVNETDEDVSIVISLTSQDGPMQLEPTVEVGPQSLQRLDDVSGDFANAVAVDSVDVIPGTLVEVQFETSTGEIASARIPVLLPEGPFEVYAEALGYEAPVEEEGAGEDR